MPLKTSIPEITQKLTRAGVQATLQRVAIAQVLFSEPVHLRADEVYERAQKIFPDLSRATVYNTLRLFRDSGLIRELVVDAKCVIYDSTVSQHFHVFDVDTGMIADIPADGFSLVGTPRLPPEWATEQIDVIVRVRSRSRQP